MAGAQLFVKAAKIYPKLVQGKFRTLKYLAMIILLGIYYGAPWLRWDRGPHVPNQAILIDLVGQRGYFFGIEIWPQEVYLIVGIFFVSAVGLFFATALFGRIWCGYACPQTVWTDFFVWVERLFQGDRNARMRLDQGPWTFNKLWRKLATHIGWLIIGAATGGAWVLYFNDAPTVIDEIKHFDLNPTVLGWIIALTFSTYFMAGYARENICTYVCPYARFQSAMFDRDTLVIQYAQERGEPRGKHKKGESWEGRGHCVDCEACVVVCPMGIDIRDGLQYECISCGLCIDACNKIMKNLDLPKGLIHYDTENNQQVRASDISEHKPKPRRGKMHWLRPRTAAYALILAMAGGAMLTAIWFRPNVEVNIIHNRTPLFVKLSDGTVRNVYMIKVLNKSFNDKHYGLKIAGLPHAQVHILEAGDRPTDGLNVAANAVGEFRVLIETKATGVSRRNIAFSIIDSRTDEAANHESYFLEP